MRARESIAQRLDRFIERGRSDASIRAAVNATDVIVFGAMVTQPLRHSPDWDRTAKRQIAIFINGLAEAAVGDIPGAPVSGGEIEQAFAAEAPD